MRKIAIAFLTALLTIGLIGPASASTYPTATVQKGTSYSVVLKTDVRHGFVNIKVNPGVTVYKSFYKYHTGSSRCIRYQIYRSGVWMSVESGTNRFVAIPYTPNQPLRMRGISRC